MKTTRQLALAAASLAALLHLQAEVTITRHPTNQVVSLNAHVTNSVTATSTAPPITYQWYGKGALLPDETNRTLVLRSVMLDQAGEYYVVVNDAGNQPVQSDPATFTVNPTFEKITEGPLVTDVEPTESSTWWDYDNDGDLDVVVHVAPPRPHGAGQSFYRNDGNSVFTKITTNAVAQTPKLCLIGAVGDVDNDGDLDLFITRGQTTTTTNLLYTNNGDGTFTQVTFGSLADDQGLWAGSAWADYDNNGFQDLFVTSHAGFPEVLYRNHGNANHWISFKLVGTRSNRAAIGAKVRVQATIFGKTTWQLREVGGGNRHQNDLRPHFGLGDAPRATTVRVEWPSGAVEKFSNLARDQFHTIVEPSLRGAIKPTGEFELAVTGSTNRTCTIEHSRDLVNWTVLTTVTGQGETPVTVTDPDAPGQGHRFYRMR
jgi:enediyne biosynthesis protein E4